MKLNRHSIFLKLNVLFAIALLSITVVFLTFSLISQKRQMGMVFDNSKQIMRLIRTANKINPSELPVMLKEEGFKLIEDKSTILKYATPINKFEKHLPPIFKKRLSKKMQILRFHRDYYYHITLPKFQLLIKNKPQQNSFIWLILIYLTIIAIMIIIYITLRRALKPIKKLESEIQKFGNGDLNINTQSHHKDEIAAVANHFHDAVQKIKTLQDTRTLFLRNIMHELKTPITKGKLSLSLMETNSEKEMLNRIFNRLESLINEMADIERISTQNIQLDIKEHTISDIINEARELLYLETDQIHLDAQERHLHCDFHLFTIAVKNLIDNAIKYSSDETIEITTTEKQLIFTNKGKPLTHKFEHYLEPFYKGELNKINQKGFGLGLYIVSEIVKIHGFSLSYSYTEGNNIFIITL
ncbi:MAG: ArsS family sensor histidine kinase [Epsilonproteobacteria bacterium]|nr:ArsS family sensor histidine kinase [Campylobacterota bacterium]